MKKLLCFAALYLLLGNVFLSAQCQETDYIALRALYLSTGGDDWDNNTGWLDSLEFIANPTMPVDTDVSTWYGVTTDVDGCVIRLNLSTNTLIGSIPPQIGNLTNLIYLRLSSNDLSGSIPVEIDNLSSLTNLWLGSNQFSGIIPIEIGNLDSLTYLSLSNNQFSGSIPIELGNLDSLAYLSLHTNQLSGCYDSNLSNLCGQLDNGTNYYISNGNNFDATWEDFCTTDAGICIDCQQQDYIALRALYLSTDGDNWNSSHPDTIGTWPDEAFFNINFTRPDTMDVSIWYGVHTNTEGCVTCIDMDGWGDCGWQGKGGNNLSGTIPPEIGNLHSLKYLRLPFNNLIENIPPELGDLSNLEGLYLEHNDLTDAIPPELGNLSNLEEMSLSNNHLTGNIPPELGQLTNMQHLYLHYNDLTDSIPAELGNLTNLLYLNLSNNTLIGSIPPQIGNLSSLTNLWLGSNQFSGIIPVEIGNLDSLTYLSLSDNQFSGSIPIELGNLDSLTYLSLSDNQFSGSIPIELGNLDSLAYLSLHTNKLSGCYDSNLSNLCGQLDNGTNYYISNGNNFDATWEDFCTTDAGICIDCQQQDYIALRALYLSTDGDNWNSSHPDTIGTWPDEAFFNINFTRPDTMDVSIWYGVRTNTEGCVTCIDMDGWGDCGWQGKGGNNLSGTIPPEIGSLHSLKYLRLPSNNLIENIPPELGDLSNLEDLYLGCNELTDAIPPELGNLSNLEEMSLDSNHLNSNIPPELGNLSKLTSLGLGNNNLTGVIPETIASLPNLGSLHLSGNGLTGTIPNFTGDTLRVLRLDNNKLAGTIPSELAEHDSLGQLMLNQNELTGNIPPELGQLTNMRYLYLHNNVLTDSIPAELGNLTLLLNLNLSRNQLTGSIPKELGNLNILEKIDLSYNQLCGIIPPELGNLNILEKIDLSYNQLCGIIPPELGNLNILERIDLSHNQLCGIIPPELASDSLRYLTLNDNKFCGCYDPALNVLCDSIPDNSHISDGNNFDIDWQTFCADPNPPACPTITPLTLDATDTTPPSCNDNDGSITLQVSGGMCEYKYAWNDGLDSIPNQSELAAGTYSVTITDCLGSMLTSSITLPSSGQLDITCFPISPESAPGASDGTIEVFFGSAGPPLSYDIEWSGQMTDSIINAQNNIVTGLQAGNYSLTVTDQNNCTAECTFEIIACDIAVTSEDTFDVTTFGGSDGALEFCFSGGTAPFTATYSGNNTGVSGDLGAGGSCIVPTTGFGQSGLPADTYTIVVTDTNQCTHTFEMTINEPPDCSSFKMSLSIDNNVNCTGGNNGQATATPTGGTPDVSGNYSYQWSASASNQNTGTATNLPTGTHAVTVTDDNACEISGEVFIAEPDILSADISIDNNVNCTGGNNGQATATPTGGTPDVSGNYSYQWSASAGNQTTTTVTGLLAGTHSVTVTDANSCEISGAVTIGEPTELSLSILLDNNVNCNGGNNGQATANPTGGTPDATGNYTYQWSPSAGNQTTATATNLPAATHTVTITDANDCITFASIQITEPTAIVATDFTTPASCVGNDGEIDITVTGGTPPYTFDWDNDGIGDNDDTEDLTNLPSGSYNVTVTDANSCIATASASVNDSVAPKVTTKDTDTTCGAANGTATVIPTGGTMPYTFQWDDAAMQTTETATDLPSGSYNVTVTDANSCIATASASVNDSDGPRATTKSMDATCGASDGTATVTVTGGSIPYTYQWSHDPTRNQPTADSLTSGIYSLTITDAEQCTTTISVEVAQADTLIQDCDDENPCTIDDIQIVLASDNSIICEPCTGISDPTSCHADCVTTELCDDEDDCTVNDTQTISADGTICECIGTPIIEDEKPIDVPTGITPYVQDGQNDKFTINDFNSGEFTVKRLIIYNRAGQTVYYKEKKETLPIWSDEDWWDGTCNVGSCNGELLPKATYYYTIDYGILKCFGDGYSQKGSVFIL